MPYFVTVGETKFDVEDLPLQRWAKIQKDTGIGWVEALSNGTLVSNAAVAVAVVIEVADFLGAEVPILTVATIKDVFSFEAKDNIPEEFTDGVPDPKASATEPETI